MNLRQEIEQRFNQHGIQMDIDDENDASLSAQFIQQDPETLREVLREVSEINDLDLPGDEYTQSLTVSFALINALENDADSITEADIESAKREVAEALGVNQDDESDSVDDNSDDTQEASTDTDESTEDSEPVRKHNPALKETVYNLVRDNPDAQKAEVVERTLDVIPDANEGTVAVHYYNVRKELDLGTIGKRGRPANSGKLPQIRKMIQDNPDTSRADIIERCVNELGLKESTAANYYAKACK